MAVILSGTLPSLPMFQDAAGNVLGITIYKSVKLTFPAMIEIAIILLAALLSFKTVSYTHLDVYKRQVEVWQHMELTVTNRSRA